MKHAISVSAGGKHIVPEGIEPVGQVSSHMFVYALILYYKKNPSLHSVHSRLLGPKHLAQLG